MSASESGIDCKREATEDVIMLCASRSIGAEDEAKPLPMLPAAG